MTSVTAVDALPPVSLDELVSGADLQARVDRKYLLPESSLPELLVGLPHTTRALQMEGRRSFAYRSVYLDTPDLLSYHSAGRGRRLRFKVRGRGYLDVGVTWLEVKTRAARGVTVKVRVPHDDVERKPLSGLGRDFVSDSLRGYALRPGDVSSLAPVLVTTYRRTTLFLPGHDGRPASRGTVDTRLAFHEPGSGRSGFSVGGLAVVETKGGAAPSALDLRLWRMGHRPVVMSKYGTGLSAVRGDLPDLKWHRTLRRHLRPFLDSSKDTP